MLEKALNLRFSLAVYIFWITFIKLLVLTRMSKFASLFAVCKRGSVVRLTEVLNLRCLFTFYFKLVFADNNLAILDLLTFCH